MNHLTTVAENIGCMIVNDMLIIIHASGSFVAPGLFSMFSDNIHEIYLSLSAEYYFQFNVTSLSDPDESLVNIESMLSVSQHISNVF